MKYQPGTFVIVPNKDALRGESGNTQSVYYWICNYLNKEGECWPSIDTLSEDAGCSRDTTKRALERLEELGILSVEHRGGQDGVSLSNKYAVLLKESADFAPLGANHAGGEGLTMHPELYSSELKERTEIGISDSTEEEEDVKYIETDEDGNEIKSKVRKSPQERKDTTSIRILHNFQERVHKINPSVTIAYRPGYIRVLEAMKAGLTEKQIYDLFDDWFAQKGDEEAISVTAALSTNSINTFKVRENIT
jgi:hypothetical protein